MTNNLIFNLVKLDKQIDQLKKISLKYLWDNLKTIHNSENIDR